MLSERYRILQKLGEGGMGVVYLAEHVLIEKKVALKVLFPDLTRRSDLVQRFMQEAKSASRIGHENVIDITDFGQSPEGYVFIAMEYLMGQDLGQVLKASGPMPWLRAQPIILQIVKALRAAHERGIVHRDMKPENVFVLPRDDGREFVKVLDFGIAKVLGLDEDAPRLTRTGMIFGTPEYMSPEQAQGQQVDHRVDIYAVGCMMYHILTGDVPFKAESFMGILSKHMVEAPVPAMVRNPAIEPEVDAVISRAMEKDPAKRFQTMREFVEALVPLGYVPDMSGAISMVTGMPAYRTGMPRVPTYPLPPAPAPTTGPAPPATSAPAPPSDPLPHSTKQIEGRGHTPLAPTNPEARRSQTEFFSRDGGEVPRRQKSGGNLVVVAVGAGAVLVMVIVFLVLRAHAPTPAAGTTAGAGALAVPSGTAAAAAALPSGTAPPAAAAASAVSAPRPGAPADTDVGRPAGGAAPAANSAVGSRKSRDVTRPHRSSREAIDSLFPSEPTESPAAKARVKAGTQTPDDLKNPFASPNP
ncbi:MAG: serine/threonine-protein kinase [Verrucomicrobiota bacterium]